MKPSSITRFSGPLAAAIAALLFTHAASAADGTFISTTAGPFNWSSTSSWSGGTVADGADSTAYFTADITGGNQTVTLDADRTIGNITFTDPTSSHNLVISGTSTTLTLDRTTGTPTINVTQSGRTLSLGNNTGMVIAGSDGLLKTGLGVLTINGTTSNSLTGGLTLNGGTLNLNFTNFTSGYTDIINSGNALTLNGGLMTISGDNSANNTFQTFNGLTVNGAGSLLVNPNGAGSNGTTVNLAAITTATGSSLVLGRALSSGTGTLAITSTTDKDATTGIYGGRIVYATGTAATGYDWATSSGPGPFTLDAYTGYDTTLPTDGSGAETTHYSIAAGVTLAANDTINSLKITGSATALDLTGYTLNLKSGGLLSVGTTNQVITGGSLTTGTGASGSADLVIHQYNNSSNNSLAISSNISDNGSTKVNLVKAGLNNLVLAGNHSYTGDTYVNTGTLFVGHSNNQIVAGSLGGGSYAGNIRINLGATLHFNNTGNQTLSGVISGDGNLTKSSANELVLSGNNTYTGTTSITSTRLASTPTLSVSSFNSVGTGTGYSPQSSSSLGAPTTVATGTINISAANGGGTVTTLNYTGGGETTDRVLRLTMSNGGGVVLKQSGNGLLKFVSNITAGSSSTATGGLVLAGTGNGEIAGAIPEFTTATTGTSLTKQDSGTWTLSGISTYAGNTTINGGTLDLSTVANAKIYQSATAGFFTTPVVTVNTGGTLKVAHFGYGNTIQSLGQLTTDAARVVVNGGKIQFGAVSTPSTYTNDRAITVGANGATLEVLSGVTYTMSAGSNLNSYTANATLTLAGEGAGQIAKAISGSDVALVKTGAGSWSLSGANDYTGTTTVNAGTLTLAAANASNETSTVTIATGATLNLTFTGTDTVDKLFIGTTQMAAGIYGAMSSGAQFEIPEITGSGTLTVTSGPVPAGFATWITGTFANGTVPGDKQGPNDDADNDGIRNLVEYAIDGEDPTVPKATIGSFDGTTLSFTKRAGTSGITCAIQESISLGVAPNPWTEVTGGTYTNNATTISYAFPVGGPAKNFLRLQVTTP